MTKNESQFDDVAEEMFETLFRDQSIFIFRSRNFLDEETLISISINFDDDTRFVGFNLTKVEFYKLRHAVIDAEKELHR